MPPASPLPSLLLPEKRWFIVGPLTSEEPAAARAAEHVAGDNTPEQGGAYFEELKADELCSSPVYLMLDKGTDALSR